MDYDSLDFNSPNLAATAGALNGNSATNQAPISFSITGLSISNGSTFWIRWTDFNISGSDDGLAVDNFSLTPRIVDFAPEVVDTFPVNGATDFPINANLTVMFSEPVNVTLPGSHSSVAQRECVNEFQRRAHDLCAGPEHRPYDGETCTLTVLANQVSDLDANDPPDNMV